MAEGSASPGTAIPQPVASPALPPLELQSPRPDAATGAVTSTRDVVHVLGRTDPAAQVRVGGEPAVVFSSGVFVRDGVPLAPGRNPIRIEASLPGGGSSLQWLPVDRIEPPPGPDWPADRDWIDGASLQPSAAASEPLRLAPGEPLEISLRATPGRVLQARLPGETRWQPLAEHAPGRYRGLLGFASTGDVEPAPPRVRLVPQRRGARTLVAQLPAAVGQWREDPTRLVAVLEGGVELRHGLHEVRLGGPYLGELPPGTLLAATGERNGFVRVRLAPTVEAWAPRAAVAPAPLGTRLPRVAFTSVSVRGEPERPGVDTLSIPLTEPVPWQVRVEADAAGRHTLKLDLYGAHHATTWVTHRADLSVVRELAVEQAGAGTVRLTARLAGPRLWGWRADRVPGALRVQLFGPPVVSTPERPLEGLLIAVEAGHGGPTNLGAVGPTGTPEKDFNRWTTDLLIAELQAAGARVLDVREGDSNPSLRERTQRAQDAGAQLYLSVHANAADTARGHLRVSGVSTYYRYATGQPLAAAVQRRLLTATGLADFGLVGNFNYAPLRWATAMPAVLVEQAFVSHPGDEARLLDPAFRAVVARAVREGLEDALRAG